MAALHLHRAIAPRWEMGVQYDGFADRPGNTQKKSRKGYWQRHKYHQSVMIDGSGSRKNGGEYYSTDIYIYNKYNDMHEKMMGNWKSNRKRGRYFIYLLIFA